MKLRIVAGVVAAAGILGATQIAAADGAAKSKDWNLDVMAGVKFDDRVTADETDLSGTGDFGAVFGIDAGYRLVDDGTSRIEIGYDFNQTIYQDLSAFDYQEHNPSISAWTKALGGVKLGVSYEFVHSTLGGDFYLRQHILTPSIGVNLSDDVQLNLSYRYYDKDYNALDDDRDGTTHQPAADLYYYFDKKAYVMVGAGYTDENTEGTALTDPYDYSGFLGRVAVQVPIDPFGMPGRFKLSYNYQVRDYDDPTSLTPLVPGETRHDDRQSIRAYADAEIVDDLKLFVDYRFMDRGSNLATADYNKNVANIGLEYSF